MTKPKAGSVIATIELELKRALKGKPWVVPVDQIKSFNDFKQRVLAVAKMRNLPGFTFGRNDQFVTVSKCPPRIAERDLQSSAIRLEFLSWITSMWEAREPGRKLAWCYARFDSWYKREAFFYECLLWAQQNVFGFSIDWHEGTPTRIIMRAR